MKVTDQDPEPDPLVRCTDPRIRIRTTMSRIRNTAQYQVQWDQTGTGILLMFQTPLLTLFFISSFHLVNFFVKSTAPGQKLDFYCFSR